jgi:UDP-N-acetylglucosamine transferase subunit ALG13
VRQLLDLEPVWRDQDYFFVTEDTALGRSLAREHPVRFVSHYALGQARIGQTLNMVRGAFTNIVQSIRIAFSERPDIVISTGAGAVFFVALTARLLGARFILIDSFARFDKPSKFARIAKPFATHVVVQSPALKAIWPDAQLFDPLRMLDEARPPKQPLMFATVGATLPFPRLVDAVLALKDSGALPEDVVIQVGDDPKAYGSRAGVEIVGSLDFERVQAILRDAELVVCHGGTGSLITALRAGCRTVAMPRRFALKEHYDNHQEEITAAFADRGLIEVALEAGDLGTAIERLRARPARMATTDPSALMAWLRSVIG